RLLHSALLAGLAATDDLTVARLVLLAGAALRHTRRVDRVPTARRLALATTVRVVDRVHRHTAHRGPLALPARPAGLAPVDVRVFGVADLAHRRTAARVDVADRTRRHPQLRPRAFLGHQLDAGTGRTRDLRAATGPQLDRVHDRTDRDVAQRQIVAGLDVGAGTGLDARTLPQPRRREDVALVAVGVMQQRDPRRAVGVVLDVRDLGRHAVLVRTAEVDDPVLALVAATLMPGRDSPGAVPPALLGQRPHERLLRLGSGDLDEVGDAGATPARCRRLVLSDCHSS